MSILCKYIHTIACVCLCVYLSINIYNCVCVLWLFYTHSHSIIPLPHTDSLSFLSLKQERWINTHTLSLLPLPHTLSPLTLSHTHNDSLSLFPSFLHRSGGSSWCAWSCRTSAAWRSMSRTSRHVLYIYIYILIHVCLS